MNQYLDGLVGRCWCQDRRPRPNEGEGRRSGSHDSEEYSPVDDSVPLTEEGRKTIAVFERVLIEDAKYVHLVQRVMNIHPTADCIAGSPELAATMYQAFVELVVLSQEKENDLDILLESQYLW